MEKLILFAFSLVFVFLGRLILYLISKRKKKKKGNDGISIEIKYLCTKFKLDRSRIDKKSFAALISFLDALIISTTLIIVISITENFVLELLLGMFILLALIFVVYEIVGRILVKKGFDKNGI